MVGDSGGAPRQSAKTSDRERGKLKMPKLLPTIWAYLVAWTVSALIHTLDSAFGGPSGLASFSHLLSVSAVAAGVFLPPIVVCQFVYARRGRRGLAMAVTICSVTLGAILAAGGSTATSAGGLLVSCAGTTALVAVMLVVGLAPLIVASISRSGSRRRRPA